MQSFAVTATVKWAARWSYTGDWRRGLAAGVVCLEAGGEVEKSGVWEADGGLCANFIVSHVNIGGSAVLRFFVGIRDMRRFLPERLG